MKIMNLAALALAWGATLGWGQNPGAQPGAKMSDDPARDTVWNGNLGNDPLGRGDLVYVSVAGAPELSRSFRLDADGNIALPIRNEKVKLLGLTPDQAAVEIKTWLVERHVLVAPIVSISVLDYRSRQVTVVGAVKQPGMVEAVGELTVLGAIAKAGGLTPEAGANVVVTRHVDGQEAEYFIALKNLLSGGNSEQDMQLHGGDEVRVPEAPKIFIVGNIKTPGVYPLSESNGTTVLKALAMSQGQLAFSTREAYIYRSIGGKREEIPVPLRRILHRSAPDVELRANDILYVPESSGMHLTANVLGRMASFGSTFGTDFVIFH